MNQSQTASAGQAALGGDLQRHVVQVRVELLLPRADPDSAGRPADAMSGPTPVSGCP